MRDPECRGRLVALEAGLTALHCLRPLAGCAPLHWDVAIASQASQSSLPSFSLQV